VEKVRDQAAAYGHSLKREFSFLLAHSMLHLCGYDHAQPEEAACMEDKQERILSGMGITR
jgi:probable rRNA maturation factor